MLDKAREFAVKWHGAQIRKYTGEPYVNHLAAVAHLVSTVPHTEDMLAIAWLHDVVEDTPVRQSDIFKLFGSEVSVAVSFLTDMGIGNNRAEKKEYYKNQLASAPPHIKTIKLADLIDNTESIVAHDPNFAKVYLKEKAELLKVLKSGDPTLWLRAKEQLDRYT